jgi:hypothetical protein
LKGEWSGSRPVSAHKLLNLYVHQFCDFTPTDVDPAPLNSESDAGTPQIDTFAWSKIEQGASCHLLNYPLAYYFSEPSLLEDLSKSMCDFMAFGKSLGYSPAPNALVETGLGQFFGKQHSEPCVIIAEPLAVMSIMQYLVSKGKTVWSNIYTICQHTESRGRGFEAAVLLSMTKLLQNEKPMAELLSFQDLTPEWATCTAQLVRRSSDNPECFVPHGDDGFPTTNLAQYAETPKEVTNWLKSGMTAWCFPGTLMGPDIIARVRLSNGNVVLLAVQVKCHLSGNEKTVTANVTAEGIRSLIPATWFHSLVYNFHSPQVRC